MNVSIKIWCHQTDIDPVLFKALSIVTYIEFTCVQHCIWRHTVGQKACALDAQRKMFYLKSHVHVSNWNHNSVNL